MPDYMKMYSVLFNAVSDAVEILESAPEKARELLISAQIQTEEIYIETSESK